jgi:drug/metabolite transporter (DMT)-like permease
MSSSILGQNNTQERLGKLYMIAAMMLSGTIGWFVMLTDMPVFNVVFFRCLLGTIGLSAYSYYRGYWTRLSLSGRQITILILGAITLSANWCFLFSAYRLTSIGITTVIYNVQPFLLLIASFVAWREKPSNLSIAWLVLAFIGLVVLAMPWSEPINSSHFWGIVCALAAALLYAASTLLTKSLSQVMRPELIAVGHMATGILVFLPLLDFQQLPDGVQQGLSVLVLGFVHSTLMYVLLYGAYKKSSTASIAILGFIYPLTAVLVDFLVYGKVLTLSQAIGGVMIALAAACYAARINPMRRWQLRHSAISE